MIDKKRLKDEIGLDDKFCDEILNMFFKQFPIRLNTIAIAYRTKNFLLLKDELHQLLGLHLTVDSLYKMPLSTYSKPLTNPAKFYLKSMTNSQMFHTK